MGAKHRVLIYSHDSFGLGHLRRCMTIANRLVANRKGLSVLIAIAYSFFNLVTDLLYALVDPRVQIS